MEAYKESVAYDANGNILKYLRQGANGAAGPLEMDSLTYQYNRDADGNLLNNRLDHVRDAVAATNYKEDLDNQSAGNYSYDKIGNLISDAQENISGIGWTVYGKIKSIDKSSGSDVRYGYDAGGNRTFKEVTNGATVMNTYYVRDAQGNVLATYSRKGTDSLHWNEQHLYGSSRLGMWQWNKPVPASAPNVTNAPINDAYQMGSRTYELSNHLGNVLATISDKKIGVPSSSNSSLTGHFVADITSSQDYYPFGMLMPGRRGTQVEGGWAEGSTGTGSTLPQSLSVESRVASTTEYKATQQITFEEGFASLPNDAFVAEITTDNGSDGGNSGGLVYASGGYRYGFNGKENDGEIKGDGNQYDFGERIYDPRVGRFLSCDRMTPYTPFYSPYLFAGNKPTIAIDQNGDIEIIVHFHTTTVDPISGKRTTTHTSTKLDILTVQDLRSRPRTPAEVNVYILNTATAQRNGNMTNYVWSSSLNAVEDKKNTGVTAAEAEKANSPTSYYLNEAFKSVAKGIGVLQLTEAAVGENVETGERKAAAERWVDFTDGVVTALSMGRMGVTARLKTWAKDAARDQIAEKSIPMMMDILGIKDETQRAVFGYYMGLALADVAGGKLTRIKDAVIKSLEVGVKGSGQIIKELQAIGVGLNMPKDKDAALRQAVSGQLSQFNSSSDQQVKSQYEKKHD